MSQQEIIDIVTSLDYEIDDFSITIVKEVNNYCYEIEFVAWEGLFSILIYNKNTGYDISLVNKTIDTLYEYFSDIYNERSRSVAYLRDTQDFLDIYGR